MMKRLVAVLAIAVMTLTFAVTAPDAQANGPCNPTPEAFATNPATGAVVASSTAIAISGWATNEIALAELQAIATPTPFALETIAWLQFKLSGRCAAAVAGPGTIENMPAAPTGPYGWGTLNPVAAAPAAEAPASVAVDGAPALAHTGSEAQVLAFVGAGLIGFGALALGSRRRLF